jgi:hypothetical protein
MILKTVTLQEANSLLPIVREHFFRINFLMTHLQNLKGLTHEKAKIPFMFDRKNRNIKIVKNTRNNKKYRALIRQVKEIEKLVENELSEMMRLGAVIKGLFPPHIDFLSIHNQQVIFLCWHGGESFVEHWHHLDDGSPHRHKVAPRDLSRPQLVH